MIPNVKKVSFSFGASVTVKQPSSLLNNVCSKCKVTYNFQEWHQNIKLQIFIQVNITVGKKLKTCQEQPHLLSGHFVV